MSRKKRNVKRMVSNLLILALACDSAYVVGKQIGSDAWPPIVLYWVILTAKNAIDWIGDFYEQIYNAAKHDASDTHDRR